MPERRGRAQSRSCSTAPWRNLIALKRSGSRPRPQAMQRVESASQRARTATPDHGAYTACARASKANGRLPMRGSTPRLAGAARRGPAAARRARSAVAAGAVAARRRAAGAARCCCSSRAAGRRSAGADRRSPRRHGRRCRRRRRRAPWCAPDWRPPRARHGPDWRSARAAGRRSHRCCRASAARSRSCMIGRPSVPLPPTRP